MADTLIRGLSKDGFIKVVGVSTTELTERARNIHMTLPLGTAALGRTLAAASMMGSQIKNDLGSVTIRINGGGPLGSVIAVSDNNGNVRGYVQDGSVDLPLKPNGKLDVSAGVGTNGLLSVIRDNGKDLPFTGQIELISGEIAEDIAAYYVQSEQIPTVCALGVLVDRDQSVKQAGGFILQLMPNAPEPYIDILEDRIIQMKGITNELEKHGTIEKVIEELMWGFDFEVLEKHEIKYECKCSREKVEKAFISMGREELMKLMEDDKPIEATCNFCDVIYKFTNEDIEELLKKI
ncbi:MAG: Hsp33 family molecular chaperone HslO [Ruminococcaceae bacterium]|nr:Hsp33 family molecular chaperone HslO [Oscillospiraceae bacterium]